MIIKAHPRLHETDGSGPSLYPTAGSGKLIVDLKEYDNGKRGLENQEEIKSYLSHQDECSIKSTAVSERNWAKLILKENIPVDSVASFCV